MDDILKYMSFILLLCAKAKRQQQMFYLREGEASAAKRPVGTEINHTLW
ncbi:hypothetical protein ACIQ57_07800 [Lysinibacillus xylanilyticus]